MGLIAKTKAATRTRVGILGLILWIGGGLVCSIWALDVMFTLFGAWTIFVGLILAPVTYVASVYIIWFSTGIFPVIPFISYIASFFGLALVYTLPARKKRNLKGIGRTLTKS